MAWHVIDVKPTCSGYITVLGIQLIKLLVVEECSSVRAVLHSYCLAQYLFLSRILPAFCSVGQGFGSSLQFVKKFFIKKGIRTRRRNLKEIVICLFFFCLLFHKLMENNLELAVTFMPCMIRVGSFQPSSPENWPGFVLKCQARASGTVKPL